jgi:transposase-like protein
MSILNAPHFHDEHAAVAQLESILWPNGPVCPRCGKTDKVYEIKGKTARPGLRTCGKCRKQFTVKIGTLFEDSHVPMHKWWQAVHLLVSSKKGISSHQLHCTLKVTYKTAWFMSHCIREAMRSGELEPTGIKGKIVEVDETFIGQKKGVPKRRGTGHKHAVLSLVECGGQARTVHVEDVKTRTVVPIVNANLAREARVMTDDALQYEGKLDHFGEHGTVNHSAGECVRGEVHTNTVESYFALFKRGMKGVYQHCSEKHLHLYLAEFDFRYNAHAALGVDDEARTTKALAGVKGKRLKYRDSSPASTGDLHPERDAS